MSTVRAVVWWSILGFRPGLVHQAETFSSAFGVLGLRARSLLTLVSLIGAVAHAGLRVNYSALSDVFSLCGFRVRRRWFWGAPSFASDLLASRLRQLDRSDFADVCY